MKQTIKRTIVASAAVMILVTPSIASAHDGVDDGHDEDVATTSTSPSPRPTVDAKKVNKLETELRNKLQERAKEREVELKQATEQEKGKLHERLEADKKKVCEKHVSTITRVMTAMNNRRQNAFDRITKVSEAVQAFYVKKNLTVANYDDLVAQVNAAKSVAQSATEAQTAVPSINCDGDHPRADIADFKEKRSASIDAIKAYRDAVKALVKAVKAAAEATQTSEGTAS